jgi:insulysin
MECKEVCAAGEGHNISFTFQMPSLLKEYQKKADDYWGHVLGHEGPGSLLSALKARQWATGLSAGVHYGDCLHSTLHTVVLRCMHRNKGA